MPNTAWQPGQPLPDGMTPSNFTPNGGGSINNPDIEPTPIPFNTDNNGDGFNPNQMGGMPPWLVKQWYNDFSSGGNPQQMGAYDPNFNYGSPGQAGSGGPTQKWMGVLGSLLGGAAGSLIPGGSMIGSKLGGMGARAFTRMLQNMSANRSGGGWGNPDAHKMGRYDANNYNGGGFDPFGGLPPGFTEQRNPQGAYGAPVFTGPGDFGPNFTGDSIFGGRTNLAMALPGSFTGLGTGSAGGVNMGGDYFGNESMNRLMQGGDATLGFGMTGNNTFLPPNQWGGVGAGGSTQGGSRIGNGTGTQRRMSNV